MEHIPVKSQAMTSYGYEAGVLEVEIRGVLYRYSNVPQDIADGLAAAPSKGKYFQQHVKPKFTGTRVSPDEART